MLLTALRDGYHYEIHFADKETGTQQGELFTQGHKVVGDRNKPGQNGSRAYALNLSNSQNVVSVCAAAS